jgi:hypothetical protein
MNPNEQPMNERQTFDELFGADHFEDSVSDQHQSELRSKVLQAFDQSNSERTIVELRVPSTSGRQHASGNRSLGYVAILAVCLIGLVAIWLYQGSGSDSRRIVDNPRIPGVPENSQLLASLAAVNAFRDEVPREALFGAIAMCEQDHDGRMFFDSTQP